APWASLSLPLCETGGIMYRISIKGNQITLKQTNMPAGHDTFYFWDWQIPALVAGLEEAAKFLRDAKGPS
ncbi:MAG: hypothetical protein AAB368_03360, partial [bacterium]